MSTVMLGTEVAKTMKEELIRDVELLKGKGIHPCLAIIRVGARGDDLAYERSAKKRMEMVGIDCKVVELPKTISQENFERAFAEVNDDPKVDGILLFRPLPEGLDEEPVKLMIHPEKDVDCMTDLSNAGVFEGRSDLGFAPCTPAACMEILDYYGIDCKGKNAVVIGRSLVVGKPAAMMLMGKNATVTVCHTKTVNTAEVARSADILVSAAGVLGSLTKEYVRPGQVVIDVSINWDENKPNARGGLGAIAGDAVYAEVEPIVEAITPVPGGVGSVTTSVLMKHVIEAAERV